MTMVNTSAPVFTGPPQRIVFRETRDFNLQVTSRLINGRPAFKICGATTFANPYTRGDVGRAEAVALYRDMLRDREDRRAVWIMTNLRSVAGYNLACVCPDGCPCHGDVLLKLANPPQAIASDELLMVILGDVERALRVPVSRPDDAVESHTRNHLIEQKARLEAELARRKAVA
ncbi:MAG: DUF4326 domain-containing protein [Pseudolabrys sp.]